MAQASKRARGDECVEPPACAKRAKQALSSKPSLQQVARPQILPTNHHPPPAAGSVVAKVCLFSSTISVESREEAVSEASSSLGLHPPHLLGAQPPLPPRPVGVGNNHVWLPREVWEVVNRFTQPSNKDAYNRLQTADDRDRDRNKGVDDSDGLAVRAAIDRAALMRAIDVYGGELVVPRLLFRGLFDGSREEQGLATYIGMDWRPSGGTRRFTSLTASLQVARMRVGLPGCAKQGRDGSGGSGGRGRRGEYVMGAASGCPQRRRGGKKACGDGMCGGSLLGLWFHAGFKGLLQLNDDPLGEQEWILRPGAQFRLRRTTGTSEGGAVEGAEAVDYVVEVRLTYG